MDAMDSLTAAGVVMAMLALSLATLSLWIALRVARIQGNISAINAILSVELARAEKDEEVIQDCLDQLIQCARRLSSADIRRVVERIYKMR
jgi:hypothetical protein